MILCSKFLLATKILNLEFGLWLKAVCGVRDPGPGSLGSAEVLLSTAAETGTHHLDPSQARLRSSTGTETAPTEAAPPRTCWFREELRVQLLIELGLALQVLQDGVGPLGGAPEPLEGLTFPLVGLLQGPAAAVPHQRFGLLQNLRDSVCQAPAPAERGARVTHRGVHRRQLLDAERHLLCEGPGPQHLGHQALGAGLLGRQLPAAQQQLVGLEQKGRLKGSPAAGAQAGGRGPTEATPMMRGKVTEEQASGVWPQAM